MTISFTVLATKLLFTLSSISAASFLHFLLSNAIYGLRSPNVGIQQQQLDPMLQENQNTNKSSLSSSSINLVGYTQDAIKDLIHQLPGLDFQPNFHQFSGYFTVSPTRYIHYWYIESSHDPTTDPVIFWTNGGPGCSGLIGLGAEFGPFRIDKHGILSPNNDTWNQVASILYVEQPAGVGFSYYTNANDTFVDDERVTMDNYRVIQEFLDRFPQRRWNDLYIASESFGGHYIPHLAKKILDEKEKQEEKEEDSNGGGGGGGAIENFRGFLVGNPFVDPFSNYVTMIQTYYMHGLVALPLYREWEQHCTDKSNYPLHKCNFLVYTIFKQAGNRINPYALDYPVCNEDMSSTSGGDQGNESLVEGGLYYRNTTTVGGGGGGGGETVLPSHHVSVQSAMLMKLGSILNPPFLSKGDLYDPCAELHLHLYLNREDVKDALHVDRNRKWYMCTSSNIDYSREDYNKPQMFLYKELIQRARKSGTKLKMMIYSGDDDSVCSTASTQSWIFDVGASPYSGKLWRPWQVGKQTAGFLTEFDLGKGTNSSFIFVTVHGAGHEVPSYRPKEALALVKSFLNNDWDVGRRME
mmetsp:Transcript_7110/g.13450  ORF Transcript_7110/g.13450 Transcript_7110/m.13450 type:complete len:581 (-) Transcript_7110:4875-6617(-)